MTETSNLNQTKESEQQIPDKPFTLLEPEGAEPKTPRSASDGNKRRKTVLFFVCLLTIALVGGFIAWRTLGGNVQNANVTADKRRNDTHGAGDKESYDQAIQITRTAQSSASPGVNPEISPAPLPPGAPPVLAQNPVMPGGSILTDPNLAGTVPVSPNGMATGAPPTEVPPGNKVADQATTNQPDYSNNGDGAKSGSRAGQRLSSNGSPDAQLTPAGYDESGAARNEQRSLYFFTSSSSNDAAQGKPENFDNRLTTASRAAALAPVKPPFGTLLPVRFSGALHSLGNNAFTRMHLTRAVKGNGFYLPSGTVLVGRVAGSQATRIFVNVFGFIDSGSNQLVRISGDVLGNDEALGVLGERKKLGNPWRKVAANVINIGKDLANSYLLGRRGGGGSQVNVTPDALGANQLPFTEARDTEHFVVVPAGAYGYVLINDLPPDASARPAPSEEDFLGNNLSSAQQIELLQSNSTDNIRQNIQRLDPHIRELARQALSATGQKNR